MSLLKADQVRRELFVKYRRQIAAVLGETEDGDPIELCGCEETNNGGDDTKEKGNESYDEEEAQQQQEEEGGGMEGMGLRLLERFRISYARQHLLRQRAMRMPDDYIKETTEGADDAKCASHSSHAADETTPCTEAAAVAISAGATEGNEVEVEGWRLVYNEPYPSIRRIMRRVQEESLQTLMRESRVPITAYRDAAYTAQRMAVLQQMEEQIGRERAILLARQQKMDGKLHPIE